MRNCTIKQSFSVTNCRLFFEAGQWRPAAENYQRLLITDNNNGHAWYYLAESYRNLRFYPEAIAAYQKELTINDPAIPAMFAHANLAKSFAGSGDSSQAFAAIAEMETKMGYRNFPEMDSAKEFDWLRSSPRYQQLFAQAKYNAYPCSINPQNREFDFWVGSWKVFKPEQIAPWGKALS